MLNKIFYKNKNTAACASARIEDTVKRISWTRWGNTIPNSCLVEGLIPLTCPFIQIRGPGQLVWLSIKAGRKRKLRAWPSLK